MLKLLDDYDWREAFSYAGEPHTCGGPNINAVIGDESVITEPFTREDVAEIIAYDEGINDGPDWIIFGKLNDGRYFFLEAGCDYTGWDCQAGGYTTVGLDYDDMVRFALGDGDRERLNIELPKEA